MWGMGKKMLYVPRSLSRLEDRLMVRLPLGIYKYAGLVVLEMLCLGSSILYYIKGKSVRRFY